MTKDEIATIKEVAEALETERDFYCPGETPRRYADLAARLRDILPKPRFYACARTIRIRQDGGTSYRMHDVPTYTCPDDATAALIAEKIAAAYNEHVGEVES